MSTSSQLVIEKSCPLADAHTRLRRAHELWHRTVAAYNDPDEFVLNLNSLLVTLRQVTFMLQKQKDKVPDFEPWYQDWREQMGKDAVMTWLRDARNHVEKRGDLDLSSTARVRLVVDWRAQPEFEMEVSPLAGADEIASVLPVEVLPQELKDDGLVEVERRWVSKDLPGSELAEACAHGYGVMATILAEAHERVGIKMRTFGGETHGGEHVRVDHLGGRLPCMVIEDSNRVARLHLASGMLLERQTESISFDPEGDGPEFEKHAARMLLSRDALSPPESGDVLDLGAKFSRMARALLAHEGRHFPIAILFDANLRPLRPIGLAFEGQAEKMMAIRRVAEAVDELRAESVILINEAWQAPGPVDQHGNVVRAELRDDRTETLVVLVASRDGRLRVYNTPFTRDAENKPVLGEERIVDGAEMHWSMLEPLWTTWKRWTVDGADNSP